MIRFCLCIAFALGVAAVGASLASAALGKVSQRIHAIEVHANEQ